MPRVYRSMERDGNRPRIGHSARTLGVRVEGGTIDIVVDRHGKVYPGEGGMSVAPHWRSLPPHRIPRRLRPKSNEARGSNELYCWRLGDGAFENGEITSRLFHRVTSATHGVIEPAIAMSLVNFEASVANTQQDWIIDEA